MQPIQINVQVTIGVSQELCGLLSPLVGNLRTAPAVQMPTAEPAAKERKAKKLPAPEATPAAPVEAATEVETVPEPTPAEAPAEDPGSKSYTEEDVRAAMDRARQRVEGENYKEKTDSYGYKQWHRRMTAYFKSTATECGAETDKPSALPDSESRRRFIERVELVRIEGDDITDCPF